jgi:hypothetical protein
MHKLIILIITLLISISGMAAKNRTGPEELAKIMVLLNLVELINIYPGNTVE